MDAFQRTGRREYLARVTANSLGAGHNEDGPQALAGRKDAVADGLVKSLGGLAAISRLNQRKAAMLYSEIDRTGFYRGTAQVESRSLMNITFRLPSEELEKTLDRQASAAGFDGLKGHRSVGGLRSSIYNAFPEEGVAGLVDFLREFERTHG